MRLREEVKVFGEERTIEVVERDSLPSQVGKNEGNGRRTLVVCFFRCVLCTVQPFVQYITTLYFYKLSGGFTLKLNAYCVSNRDVKNMAAFQMRARFPMAAAPLTYRRPATRACAHEALSLSLRHLWVGKHPWKYRLSKLTMNQPCLYHDRDFATSLGLKDPPLRDLIQKTDTGHKFEAQIVYEDGYDSDSDGDSGSDSEYSESEEEEDDEMDDFELTYCDVEFVSTQEPKVFFKL